MLFLWLSSILILVNQIDMSQDNLIKLVHKATGETYYTRKNKRKVERKIKLKKFSKKLNKRVDFTEAKK